MDIMPTNIMTRAKYRTVVPINGSNSGPMKINAINPTIIPTSTSHVIVTAHVIYVYAAAKSLSALKSVSLADAAVAYVKHTISTMNITMNTNISAIVFISFIVLKRIMGNKPTTGFSTTTQATLDLERYSGMWYQVYNSDTSKSRECDTSIVFYFTTGTVLNMSTYCVVRSKLTNQVQHTGVAPNPYDPSKLVVRTEGVLGKTTAYWVYDTDYDTYSIVGNSLANVEDGGAHFFVLSRKPKLLAKSVDIIQEKVVRLGLTVTPMLL